MICARCAREIATGAQCCPNCSGDPLLDGRYQLEQQLAQDSISVSYRATRLEDAVLVRARGCMVRRLPAEPERSAQASRLRELEHPALPRWIEEFVVGDEPLATAWMIHEHIEGPSLADTLAAAPDGRLDEPQVRVLLRELADAFVYLHGRPTPVLHGSLTPSLILVPARRAGPRAVERGACLLDLGHAGAAVHGVGNRGLAERLAFAAPEQLYGDPIPASDIWALGAIAIVALSGASTTSRCGDQALRWRDRVSLHARRATPSLPHAGLINVSAELGELLARMLEPDPSLRIDALELCWRLAGSESNERRIGHPSSPPKQLPPRTRANERSATKTSDVPIMRPDEISRELSSAHQIANAFARRQQRQIMLAWIAVVIVAAVIAGLATYIVIARQ